MGETLGDSWVRTPPNSVYERTQALGSPVGLTPMSRSQTHTGGCGTTAQCEPAPSSRRTEADSLENGAGTYGGPFTPKPRQDFLSDLIDYLLKPSLLWTVLRGLRATA